MGGASALRNSGCGGRPLRLNDGFMGRHIKKGWIVCRNWVPIPSVPLTVSSSRVAEVNFSQLVLVSFFGLETEECLAGLHPRLKQLTEYGHSS